MKDFFKDIFEYHHTYNKLLADQISQNREKIPDDSYALFCHILNAHQIWNSRILGAPSNGVHDMHNIETCYRLIESNHQDTLRILETHDLNSTITYKNTKGAEFSNVARDILFHVNNHSTHHRAQIASRFRSLGIIPLVSDFIFYKREHG